IVHYENLKFDKKISLYQGFKALFLYCNCQRPGLRFAIREGGRTVGSGVVSKILE
ncbi:Elongation factor Tu C-terminal domain-containing protein, partial [Caloramator quimbayensis]